MSEATDNKMTLEILVRDMNIRSKDFGEFIRKYDFVCNEWEEAVCHVENNSTDAEKHLISAGSYLKYVYVEK